MFERLHCCPHHRCHFPLSYNRGKRDKPTEKRDVTAPNPAPFKAHLFSALRLSTSKSWILLASLSFSPSMARISLSHSRSRARLASSCFAAASCSARALMACCSSAWLSASSPVQVAKGAGRRSAWVRGNDHDAQAY